jgi:hypothetical protein
MTVDSFQTFGSGGQKSPGSGCPKSGNSGLPDRIPAHPYLLLLWRAIFYYIAANGYTLVLLVAYELKDLLLCNCSIIIN